MPSCCLRLPGLACPFFGWIRHDSNATNTFLCLTSFALMSYQATRGKLNGCIHCMHGVYTYLHTDALLQAGMDYYSPLSLSFSRAGKKKRSIDQRKSGGKRSKSASKSGLHSECIHTCSCRYRKDRVRERKKALFVVRKHKSRRIDIGRHHQLASGYNTMPRCS